MANDVYSLIIRGTCSGEFWETVQHYQSTVTGAGNPVVVADALITAFRAHVESDLTALLGDDNFIIGYSTRRVNNGGSPTVMRPIAPVAGQQSSESATAALAYLIVSEYSHSGQFKTGKWFIAGIPENNLAGNGYTAGAIADAGTLITSNASFAGGGDTFTWGTWSRTYSLFFTPQYAHLSAKIGIQKRRLLPV